MSTDVKLALSDGFLVAFAALPRKMQGKVTEFISKFRANPKSAAINIEKIKDAKDSKMCSVRIDDTYRGILARQEETGVYLLLWVDHHDEAYDWARRKKCEVNPTTGALQLFDVQEIVSEVEIDAQKLLFSDVSNEDLKCIGVPEEQIPFVRTITSADEFYSSKGVFPEDAYENLSWLVEGFTVDEVKELIESSTSNVDVNNLSDALDRPESMKSFVVVDGEDELRKIMAEPLEKWRVFLHPTQRKIVNKNYTGPARVLGGAGTGKTVVAMHRAKHLAATCSLNERILFTTYTANLAGDIRDNLRKICTTEEMRKIDIVNIDSWVSTFLRDQGYTAEIVYDNSITELWEDAMLNVGEELGLPASFYEDEWNRVVVAQEAFSMPLYAKATRNGRGMRLDRRKRIQVWKVIEEYQKLLKERNVRDVNMAMYECRIIVSQSNKPVKYKHIIVDEGQDLSNNAYRLLRALAGDTHANDMFIVGDSHQRIYKNRAVLSHCGVNVRGRSATLKINYRTTEEIRKAAFAILNGISFDGMDDDIDLGDKCQSLMHGQMPIIKEFKNAAEELEYLVAEVKNLNESGVSLNDICITARTHKLLEDYIASFTKSGIRSYEIKKSKTDDRALEGVRMATMHRVKGLEFKYVFIVATNDRIIPLASAIDYSDNVTEYETITSEKCLLYVAMTRAQKAVTLTCYGRRSDFIK